MRTTLDIPDPVYRRLKAAAAQRGCSVKELVLRGVNAELSGRTAVRKAQVIMLPIVDSKRPGWLQLSNREINEILFP